MAGILMAFDATQLNEFLLLLKQDIDPVLPLVDAIQLFYDTNKAVQAVLHDEGDPGSNVTHKLIDHLYATFFGERLTVTSAANIAIVAGSYNSIYCALGHDVTFTITGGTQSMRLYFILKQDGTGNRLVTFDTGFLSPIPKLAAANEYIIVEFIYDDVNSKWHEVSSSHKPQSKSGTILNPGDVNAITIMKRVDSDEFPNGIYLVNVQFSLIEDAAYDLPFKRYSGDPPTLQATIETVSTGGTDTFGQVQGSDIDNPSLSVGDYVMLDLPATAVPQIHPEIIFYPKGA